MRLNGIDEFPFHQHPAPFNMVATTDAHYNDGYWFAFYAAEWYLFTGMRLHPNVNAVDGFASVAHAGRQHSLRCSRALRPDYDSLRVGPLRLEILEPLRRLRLTLGENPAGIRFDVVFEGQSPPFVEDRYQHVKYGAIVNDTIRYTQVCRATGTAGLHDVALEVDGWHGMRDHSWGIRSSMGPPTRIGGVDRRPEEADRRAFRLWVPFEAGDHCGFFQTHEDHTGQTLDFEGRLDYRDGSTVPLKSVRHSLTYREGTKLLAGGEFDLVGQDGRTRHYELQASGSPAEVHGIGYYAGWHDGNSSGMYRGPELIEHDVYDIESSNGRAGPAHVPEKRRMGPTEFPCFLKGPGGGEGMAHVEHYIYGRYDPYSFS